MIHYHGTPLSGTPDNARRFFAGRHALVPFPRPDNLAIVAATCRSFVFDNGAFTVWRRGGQLDVEGYTRWVEEWHRHPGFDWALIPDVIEGTEADNDALLRDWPLGDAGVPVWHMHESLERLDRLVATFRTVALGSSGQWPTPGTASWWQRMSEAMAVACDAQGRPRARLHGLRMLNPEIFTRLPLASADSTNAAVNAGGSAAQFGSYRLPTEAQRADVIAACVEAHLSAPTWVSGGVQLGLLA